MSHWIYISTFGRKVYDGFIGEIETVDYQLVCKRLHGFQAEYLKESSNRTFQ